MLNMPRSNAPLNYFPLWKYIVIVVLVVVALLYALPNIYGESPSVQISPKGGNLLTAELVNKATSVLQAHHIAYFGLTKEKYSMQMRFKDTTEQMKAQELLEKALGKSASVAINLAPNSPAWLAAIGAYPMKLGLDLRGGMYFLLDVDMQTVVENHLNNIASQLRTDLRVADIHYAGLAVDKAGQRINIDFRDAPTRDRAEDYIRDKFQQTMLTEKQVGRAYQLGVTLSQSELNNIKSYAVQQTLEVMRNRVNELGVAEAHVARQGSDRVVIELPGLQDAARAKSIIGGTATLKAMLVNESADVNAAVNGNVPIGSSVYYTKSDQPYVLKNRVILTGSAITGASSGYDQNSGLPVVNVTISGPQVAQFSRVTGQNVGKGMAFVLVQKTFSKHKVDGKDVTTTQTHQQIINVATIQSQLPSRFQISGIGSSRMAQNLALMIRAGSLPAPVQIAEQKSIGPTLGLQNIKMGEISVTVAMLLVVIFMAIYYRLFGVIADIALLLNLVFIVAVMSLLPGATLTLPGIAGIVLNVGMAIDANVLIFERIREEIRNGNSMQASIHAGYERAFATIVDSNVTTLIAAVILFAIGTGAVKGFAVTLMIGIVTSMFTSITVTRGIVNKIYGARNVQRLSIGI